MAITPLTLDDLTTAETSGAGSFDVLMRSVKAHLEEEFSKGRIKGTDYATVYLGSLEHVLQNSLQFLLNRDKAYLDAQLLEVKLQIAAVELEKAAVEKLKVEAELAILEASLPKVTAEIALLNAKVCESQATFDLINEQKLKTAQETQLLTWKVTTEKAQTLATGVEDNSVIGKQKLLYAAQTTGFTRDAEQKAAELFVRAWGIRRTTDEEVQANSTNKLDDTYVGRAMAKLLTGVGA